MDRYRDPRTSAPACCTPILPSSFAWHSRRSTWRDFFFQAEDGIRDWSVTGVQTCALPILGGGTKYRNDILLDGTPLIAGNKLGYTPPMDAVTEYTVVQNSVDAEFGHSAGGIGIITMKSGRSEERRVGKECNAEVGRDHT